MIRTTPRALTTPARRGVTLVELLVVMLILTLLATLATPVFINRVNEARIATARTEVEEIAKAQQLCALTHGVYVPLQILNDLPLPEGGGSSPTGTDDVENSTASTILLIDVTKSATSQVGSQVNLANFATNNLAARVYFGWKGPYLNVNRVFKADSADRNFVARMSHPLDPWGNPYRFFSPVGIIGTSSNAATGATDYQQTSFSDGNLNTTPDRFDRYAVVSFGPDGVGGTVGDDGDDIYYVFGIDPNETTFSF